MAKVLGATTGSTKGQLLLGVEVVTSASAIHRGEQVDHDVKLPQVA